MSGQYDRQASEQLRSVKSKDKTASKENDYISATTGPVQQLQY